LLIRAPLGAGRTAVCPLRGEWYRQFLRFGGDSFQHNFETLAQRHLRGRAALTAAAHNDKQLAAQSLDNRNLAAVIGDGFIHLFVQQLLNHRIKRCIRPALRAAVDMHLQDRLHATQQLRADGGADAGFQP